MTEIRIREIKDGPFEIDTLAGLVPMAIPAEQASLTDDININGQREAITLWRNKVVDGRCRQLALVTLGNRDIKYRELNSELTADEVATYVKSVNTRRNLTLTQKTITAAKQSIAGTSGSIHTIAKAWAISTRAIDNAKYIAKYAPEFIEPLFNGKSVTVMVQAKFGAAKSVVTTKVSVIAKAVKHAIEAKKLIVDSTQSVEWNADSMIKTEAGKKWYAEKIEDSKLNPVQYMIELANHKFYIGTDVDVMVTAEGGYNTVPVTLNPTQVAETAELLDEWYDSWRIAKH